MSNDILTYLHDGIELTGEDWTNSTHSFGDLVHVIGSTHDAAQTAAVKAINRMQTMRNWFIGYYIVEFEQHGKDRAEYGSHLLKRLEDSVNRKGLTVTLFQNARKFYLLYPQMVENFIAPKSPTASDQLMLQKSATVSHKLQIADNKCNTVIASASCEFVTPGAKLISRLSFSHLREIMESHDRWLIIDDSLYHGVYPEHRRRSHSLNAVGNKMSAITLMGIHPDVILSQIR